MNNSIMASEFGLNKIEKAFLFSLLVSVVTIVAVGNIYWVCGKFGIELAPGWYQDIVDFVSSGGTIVEAFAAVAGCLGRSCFGCFWSCKCIIIF